MSQAIHAKYQLARRQNGEAVFRLDVDLQLPGSGVTAIFGPSGSGKTSLLRCIAGLENCPDGFFSLNGEVWQQGKRALKPHRRNLGYVFQEPRLLPHLNVQQNLGYARKRGAGGLSESDVEEILDTLAIAPLLTRPISALSGGERQRVAIARALLLQPKLLLMDEPLSSLDVGRKREVLPYIERLCRQVQIPVLYVSHSVDEVASLADTVVVLNAGTVVAQGAITDVFSSRDFPQLAQQQPGVVIAGEVRAKDAQWGLAELAFDGGALWLRDAGLPVGSSLRVRVLARDVSVALSCQDDSSIMNRLPARVEALEPEPDEAYALVRLRCANTPIVAKLTQRSVAKLDLKVGMSVWAQIKSVALVR